MRITVDRSAHGSTIELAFDDELEVRLGETPSTGYRWRTVHATDTPLMLISSRFALDPSAKVGGGGLRTFVFRAVHQGVVNIEFTRSRSPDEQHVASSDRFQLTVRIGPPTD